MCGYYWVCGGGRSPETAGTMPAMAEWIGNVQHVYSYYYDNFPLSKKGRYQWANPQLSDHGALTTQPKVQTVRSPGGRRCKRGLPVQFSVHFN